MLNPRLFHLSFLFTVTCTSVLFSVPKVPWTPANWNMPVMQLSNDISIAYVIHCSTVMIILLNHASSVDTPFFPQPHLPLDATPSILHPADFAYPLISSGGYLHIHQLATTQNFLNIKVNSHFLLSRAVQKSFVSSHNFCSQQFYMQLSRLSTVSPIFPYLHQLATLHKPFGIVHFLCKH